MMHDVTELLPLFLRPRDVSKALGVSIDYARRLFRENAFQTVKIGERRMLRQSDFLDWLERKSKQHERR